ncbi:MAG: SusC/RagA family TonB-linked outer membrane protein [Chitinophagaceae bacterium]|nr:SusC/RagA family TonB-linked outer membrane protein [Chitinophagaceae bacterium]
MRTPMGVAILTLYLLLRGSFICHAQKVTIDEDNKPVVNILDMMNSRWNAHLIYSRDIFRDVPPLRLHVKNVNPLKALSLLLAGMEFDISPDNGSIIISRRVPMNSSIFSPVRGRVFDEQGVGLEWASIVVKSTGKLVVAQKNGVFEAPVTGRETTLDVSYKGYGQRTVRIRNTEFYSIQLMPSTIDLDKVEVRGYGWTTHRLSISEIGPLRSQTFRWQPVVSVIDAIQGRICGLLTRQFNGVTGSRVGILLRGVNTFGPGIEPLVIIDGVPLAGNYASRSKVATGSAQGITGASGLNSLSREDIDRIDVLKDAAATSIYGSRGANGVILITTKKGRRDTVVREVHCYTGFSQLLKTSPLLPTAQYLQMREDAVYNDSAEGYAPGRVNEAYQWKPKDENYIKMTAGHKALLLHAGFSLCGGDTSGLFFVSGNYDRTSTVYPGDFGYQRGSVYGSYVFDTTGKRQKVLVTMSNMLTYENNTQPVADLFLYRLMAPSAPLPVDNKQYVWEEGGLHRLNIAAQQLNKYNAEILTGLGHIEVVYPWGHGFALRGSLGYNLALSNEESRQTIAAQDVSLNPEATASKSTTKGVYTSIIGEAMGEYQHEWEKHQINLLLGTSYQQQHTGISSINRDGYTSDKFLDINNGLASSEPDKSDTAYRYFSVFGRAEHNFSGKYLFSGTLRMDMSSRFGDDRKRGLFWSLGAGWIFTREPWMKACPWISFGKLRGSYGITGNDQVGEYTFGQVYNTSQVAGSNPGSQTFSPAKPANPQLGWELNRKGELAIDLYFLSDRISLTVAAYRHTTDNLVVQKALSSMTGYPSVMANQPVVILNKGLEFMIQTINVSAKDVSWTTSLSLTMPENKLIKFPGLASSVYGKTYQIGKSLTEFFGYAFLGVGVEDGLFKFDKDSFVPCGNFDPRWYAGMDNNVRWDNLDLSVFVEYRRQNGRSPIVELYKQNIPGSPGPSMMGNVPVEMGKYWRKPGDVTSLQKVTTMDSTEAGRLIPLFYQSSAYVTDASFLRVKSVCLGYRFPARKLKKMGLTSTRVYLSGQNLLTMTKFPVTDPETQDPRVLPPQRTFIAGIQLNF